MCIIRVEKRSNNKFAQIDNKCLETPKLSWKAKGLLSYLLSKSDNWQISLSNLIATSTDGRDSVRSAMAELTKQGYLRAKVFRDANGRYKTDYTVYEQPRVVTNEGQEKSVPKKAVAEIKDQQVGEKVAEIAKNQAQTLPPLPIKPKSNAIPLPSTVNPNNGAKNDDSMRIPNELFNYGNLRRISTSNKQRAIWVLRNIPDFQQKKLILAVLEEAMGERNLRDPIKYLAGIIKKYKAGDFVPAKGKEETEEVTKEETKEKIVSNAKEEKIKKCPICNKRGRIEMYVVPINKRLTRSSVFTQKCNHDLVAFEMFVHTHKGKIVEVFSATEDRFRLPEGYVEARKELERRSVIEAEKVKAEREMDKLHQQARKGNSSAFKKIGELLKKW